MSDQWPGQIRKISHVVPVSDEMLGLTPPGPPIPWHKRLRWNLVDWWWGQRRRLGWWIAGDKGGDDW